MINKVINIDVDYEAMGVEPSPRQTTLTTYILDDKNVLSSNWEKRPAVIVCPGGGYALTSEREAEPIALKYCSAGYHAFVLEYSIKPSGWPSAIVELSKAVMYVKEIAEENNIDAEQIYVVGFSAGGHLAGSLGVHWNHPDVVKFSGAENDANKPRGIILSYPVITSGEKTHIGSIENLVAGRDELRPLASLENHVKEDSPEMFIWHTCTDGAVPVANSLKMASALEEKGIKFELHVYPDGPHGLALASDITGTWSNIPPVQNWIDMSIRWIKDNK